MAIEFSVIPVSTNRVPGVFAEVDASNANTGQTNQNTLIIGQMTSGGTATANIPVVCPNLAQCATYFGANSMLYNMISQYAEVDAFGSLYVLPLADSGSGTAATGNIVFSGSPTAAGVFNLYVAGNAVPVAITSAQATTAIATAVSAAINAVPNIPLTASVAASTVTITSIHKGVAAGDIDLRVNYRGTLNNEYNVPGLTATITAVSGGLGDPDLATALGNLGSTNFDFIILPYTGSGDLTEFFATIGDVSGRWSWLASGQGNFGGAFSAYRGQYSALVTEGQSLNNQHISIMGFFDSPTPAYLWAASYGAACAVTLRADPALPPGGAGNGVLLPNVLAPPIQSQFSMSEQNLLLYAGMSTFLVEQGGVVRVQRAITTFQLNGASQPSDAYLDVNIPYQLAFFIRGLNNDLSSKFGQKKLVQNGQRLAFGNNTVSPQIVLNEAIAFYNLMAAQGVVENPDVFSQNASAQMQGQSAVDLFLPIDLAGQLIQINSLVQFTIN